MNKELIYKKACSNITKTSSINRRTIGNIGLGVSIASTIVGGLTTYKAVQEHGEAVAKANELMGKLPAMDRENIAKAIKNASEKINTDIKIIYPEALTRKDIDYLNRLGCGLSTSITKAKEELGKAMDEQLGMAVYSVDQKPGDLPVLKDPAIVLKPGAPAGIVKHEIGHLLNDFAAGGLARGERSQLPAEIAAWRTSVGKREIELGRACGETHRAADKARRGVWWTALGFLGIPSFALLR